VIDEVKRVAQADEAIANNTLDHINAIAKVMRDRDMTVIEGVLSLAFLLNEVLKAANGNNDGRIVQ
jgi:hypothetical protein